MRQLLSHQAGLCAIDEPPRPRRPRSTSTASARRSRAQKPAWEPGTRHGYHGITLGWYEGELIRRVDPQGRTLGRYFADEVAAPLGLDFFIGLPDDVPPERIARIHGYSPPEMLLHLHEFPPPLRARLPQPAQPHLPDVRQPAHHRPAERVQPARDAARGDPRRQRDRQRRVPSPAPTASSPPAARRSGSTPATLEALKLTRRRAERRPRATVVLHIESVFSLGYVKPFPRFTLRHLRRPGVRHAGRRRLVRVRRSRRRRSASPTR